MRRRAEGFLERAMRVHADFRVRRPRPWTDPLAVVVAIAAVLLVATRQAYTVPYTGLGLSPAQLIVFVLVLLWVASRLAGQRQPAGLGLLSALLLLQAAVTLLGYALASGRVLTADQRTGSDQAELIGSVAALAVIVLATVLRSRRDIELVLRALVTGGAVSGLFALIAYGTGVDLAARLHLPGLRDTGGLSTTGLLREGLTRSQGAAAAPLELGGVLAVLLPIGLALCFAARRRGERVWPWALATALMAGGGVVTLSRSLFLAFGAALVVMMLRWSLRRIGVVAAALVVLVGAALISGARIVDAVATVFSSGSGDYSLGSRSNGRHYVWTHFAQHFWLGQGPGTYDQTTQPVLDNQYLSQLMETGVLGLLLFVAVLVCALAYVLAATGRRVDPDARELAVGLAGALVAVLVVESVLDTAGFVQIYALIWIVVALCAAVWRLNVLDARGVSARGVSARGVSARGVWARRTAAVVR